MFDLSDDSRLTELQTQGHSQLVELLVFSFCSQGVAQNPAAGGRTEEAHCAGLRRKVWKTGF